MPTIKVLPEQLQKVACEQLGEVPARISKDLEALRTWILLQPHLKSRTEDQFLVQFLRGCKYSLEMAKQKIDYYYSMRAQNPILSPTYDVDDPKFRKLHNTGLYLPLPIPLNDNGPRIIFAQNSYDPKDFTAMEIYKYISCVIEVLQMSDPYAGIQGIVLLINFSQITAHHLAQFTVSDVKAILALGEKAIPLRIKGIILTQVPLLVENFLNIVLPFFPEKSKSLIHVCGNNLEDLEDIIPRKYFPQDYGGANGSLDSLCMEYNKVWDEYREHFKQDAEYGTDERLRLGKGLEFKGELGEGGSFRKINID